jgi:hypothetical protein
MRTQPRVIFVFGSNLRGEHGAGAARAAERFWGARPGVGIGPAGESYAIPTIDQDHQRIDLVVLAEEIDEFLHYAHLHPDQTFYVTPIGCGIAGFTPAQIAPLFHGAPAHVQLPEGWRS